MLNKRLKSATYLVFVFAIYFFASPLFFTFGFLTELTSKKNTAIEKSLYPSLFNLDDEDKKWIEDQLHGMSLNDKAAQMISVQIPPNISVNSREYKKIVSLVRDKRIGGIIFSRSDIKSQVQITNALQEISQIPLLVSADFENGPGMRLSDVSEFPYNMAIGASGDINLVYQIGKILTEQSKAIGVHQNYAPVADINNNYLNPVINVRAFSDDKEVVARYVSAFIVGSKQSRFLTTVKHFPGHGNTHIDSHLDLPKLNIDRYNLVNNELVPFIQAIRAGVHSVMIGHIEVPAIESNHLLPASLSYRVVTDLLQGELGFDGLIVTDAMNMSAVTKYYSEEEAVVFAVMAGNDVILMPVNHERAINSIIKAVEDGKLNEERINSSVRKILAAKKWLKLDENKIVDLETALKTFKEKKYYLLANELAEKSITLVKDENNILPLDPSLYYRTASISITDGSSNSFPFESFLIENFGYVNKTVLNSRSNTKDYEKAFQNAQNSDLIIIPSYIKVRSGEHRSKKSAQNFELINRILDLRKPAILISFGDPYLLTYFPQAETYLCSYGITQVSQRAMLNAILGKSPVQGLLPISIPETGFNLNDGIFIEQKVLDFNPYEKQYYNFAFADVEMVRGINEKIFPGGVLLFGKRGKILYQKPFGRFTYEQSSTLMSEDALFDLSYLTNVIAAKTAAMFLYDEDKLELNNKVSFYLPDFVNYGKENITIRDLLINRSGLDERLSININDSRESVIKAIMNLKAENSFSESNLNMIVLQLIIEKITGKSLDEYLDEKLFSPLEIENIMFNPEKEHWYYTPPTSEVIDQKKRNKGVVYDTTAFLMNGIAGHSGLFSTASDLAVLTQFLLQNGMYNNLQLIKNSTVQEWTNLYLFNLSSSSEKLFLITGKTGTSLLIDREKQTFIILLTNSIYPSGEIEKIKEFRQNLHDKIMSYLEY